MFSGFSKVFDGFDVEDPTAPPAAETAGGEPLTQEQARTLAELEEAEANPPPSPPSMATAPVVMGTVCNGKKRSRDEQAAANAKQTPLDRAARAEKKGKAKEAQRAQLRNISLSLQAPPSVMPPPSLPPSAP